MSWVRERRTSSGRTRFSALYRDPTGVERSAGTYPTTRAAERASRRAQSTVESGHWINPAAGRIAFRRYVEDVWLPSRQVEVSTLAGYRS